MRCFFKTRAIAALDAQMAFSGVGAASHRSSIQSSSRSPSSSIWGVIAPELIPQTVGKANGLYLELFVDARPFPEFDDERLGDAKNMSQKSRSSIISSEGP